MDKESFGEVRLARHIVTSTEVAVKVVNWQSFYDVPQEIDSLKELDHLNITKLFEVITTEDLFMEHTNEGTLFDYLENCSPRTEKEPKPCFDIDYEGSITVTRDTSYIGT